MTGKVLQLVSSRLPLLFLKFVATSLAHDRHLLGPPCAAISLISDIPPPSPPLHQFGFLHCSIRRTETQTVSQVCSSARVDYGATFISTHRHLRLGEWVLLCRPTSKQLRLTCPSTDKAAELVPNRHHELQPTAATIQPAASELWIPEQSHVWR